MKSRSFNAIDQARGLVDGRGKDADLFERGSYIRTLQSWNADVSNSQQRGASST